MPLFTIDVLGTTYTVIFCGEDKEPQLKDADGTCDPTAKTIFIKNDHKIEYDTVKNLKEFKLKVLRHEIVHAFLYESGLSTQCYWADNEELVDWIAIQFPKLSEAIQKSVHNFEALQV